MHGAWVTATVGGKPAEMSGGIRVEVDSANVGPEDTLRVLQAFATELGIGRSYFDPEQIHPWSRVINLALYVRIRRSINEGQSFSVTYSEISTVGQKE